ncbi:substrate-binding periplasmic protein [Pseudomonadota bacterium]
MRTRISCCIAVLVLCFSNASSATTVTIGMGNYEPYYIADGETGIFTDLLAAVFRHLPGHEPKFLFGRPNKRLWQEFKQGRIDGVANLPSNEDLGGCVTDPVFQFHDVAITKVEADLAIESVSDLAGLRVVAFQGAKEFLGDEYSKFTNFKEYTEIAQQELQSSMLFGGRADVSVGDMFLFLYSLKSIEHWKVAPADFKFHPIFPKLTTSMGFMEVGMCSQFNDALKKVRQSGEYDEIYRSYLDKLGYQN